MKDKKENIKIPGGNLKFLPIETIKMILEMIHNEKEERNVKNGLM